MIGKNSLHTHTVFSDGENTPRQMIEAALKLGMEEIGFTDHSYTFFDETYCIPKEKIREYQQTILDLKEEYRDRIRILLGIEQDYYSEEPTDAYEYVIGSVHYVKASRASAGSPQTWRSDPSHIFVTADAIYIPVDESIGIAADILKAAAEDFFGGDLYALAENYYEAVGNVVEKTGADIIGHFDVLTKCNTVCPVFDVEHPRYQAAWRKAADRLLATSKVFEINISPLMRGIKPEPYPSDEIRNYLARHGARFVVTGDCHSTAALDFAGLWTN